MPSSTLHIDVQTETEIPRGWRYIVVVRDASGHESRHDVRLSWVDHEHWSGGKLAPSRVIEAVLRYVLDHEVPTPLPERFDAARARRWLPQIDREIRAVL